MSILIVGNCCKLYTVSAIISVLFYSCTVAPRSERISRIILSTPNHLQAKQDILKKSYSLIAVYPYNCKADNNYTVPNADVFICKLFKDTTFKYADTVVLLDINTKHYNVTRPEDFEVYAKNARKFISVKYQCHQKLFVKLKSIHFDMPQLFW